MGMLELKELIRPLDHEDRKLLCQILDDANDDQPLFYHGEKVTESTDISEALSNFAKGMRQYLLDQKIKQR